MISTRRRIEYATGYLELGLASAAADELTAIDPADQDLIEVLRVRSEYHMQVKEWEPLINVAASLVRRAPDDESGWISWAYALRELNRVEEARSVLQEAELRHGKTCGVLHYNLACYACLLGNHLEALRRLRRALRINEEWKQSALGDTDLQPLWSEIAEMK